MKPMKKTMIFLALFAIVGIANAELLTVNRGFEAGNTSDWLQWASGSDSSAPGWQSWYDSWGVVNDGTAYEGNYYVNLTQNSNWWGYNRCWQGEATLIPVNPGVTLTMSARVRTTDAAPFLRLEAYDAGGYSLGADQEINFRLDGS